MKKIISCMLLTSMVFVLSGCGTGNKNQDKNYEHSMALMTDTGGINDEAFNQSAWEGAQKVKEDLKAMLSEQKKYDEVQKFINGLKNSAKIEFLDKELSPEIMNKKLEEALPKQLELEKALQEKAIKSGYTTQNEIKKQTIISIIVLYLPCFVLVPLMVCYINGAKEFSEIFIQSLLIMYIMGLFDRFFIDWYCVEHTKACDIPNTEELKPYIPKNMKIAKWFGTIIGFAVIALIIALVMSNVVL